MRAMAMGRAAPEGVALTMLTHLKNGKIDEAIAGFVAQFTFQDHGLGLEFTDTARLAAFFRKALVGFQGRGCAEVVQLDFLAPSPP